LVPLKWGPRWEVFILLDVCPLAVCFGLAWKALNLCPLMGGNSRVA
jgi:hypothetical protein